MWQMGQVFSHVSDWLHGRRDSLIEEPVAVRTVTPGRVSSSGSYDGRISQRGDSQSTNGGGYQDVGLDIESTHREQEHRLHIVARYLSGQTCMVTLPDGGHCYVLAESYEQLDADHRWDMMMWYLDQFHEDPNADGQVGTVRCTGGLEDCLISRRLLQWTLRRNPWVLMTTFLMGIRLTQSTWRISTRGMTQLAIRDPTT
ncbi:hypothetical protein FNV43_RR13332 [Rhamnella rubrinervis]|uniref:Uncharacterized protein n=1 Tax=Rhamnella rubrinervis TaxID=2594499 RepID=A0A8K0H0V0_9ROSA|nr:hypothetical protein FNV43_RR13332 [Rhamnella rubrinervis]